MNTRLPVAFFLLFISSKTLLTQTNYASYVNPFIGTGGHGHTFPGAVLPFGMVQLSPDTRVDGSWDGCSGYHYSDSIIYGFSHTHLSGTGCSDWGDILIMPTVGMPTLDSRSYSSGFSHVNEKAGAGYYQVLLEDDQIKAELTVTPRAGIHQYTFPRTTEANIILDLLHRDKTLDCNLFLMDSVTVGGYRVSEAWAKKQYVFFCMKFSKPFLRTEFANGKVFKQRFGKVKERAEGAFFRFDLEDGKPLMVKVALSPVSAEGAKKNLEAEATHWDFEKYRTETALAWETQLRKIEIPDGNKDKLVTFYTALYHCFIHPSLNMDVDHQYRGRDNKIHTASGFTNYTVFSLWDTYRALHPLFTILERGRTADFINSFLNQYKQSGRLPVWELSGNETDCMIGFHSVSVIADAMQKGITGFDTGEIYEAVKAASTYTDRGIPTFNKNGFLSVDDESESVSKSLEYAYDNWCISRIADFLGKREDVRLYQKRSLAYRNVFDSVSGCMRPRKNGDWLTPFDPSEINNHFTEGNSWQYSFYVPHDLEGLIKLHGGRKNFETKLDELFSASQKTSGREQADITGLIGQYAHGNEPSHHMAYLYNYIGKPEKTRTMVRRICQSFYTNAPDGLIGNDDCGQMSAWYVFSTMGLYPVCPGSAQYNLSEPLFRSIHINLENGKIFSISSGALFDEPVRSIELNSEIRVHSFIDHSSVLDGGKLAFMYGKPKNPVEVFGSKTAMSVVRGAEIVPAPLIRSKSQVFKDQLEVSITPLRKGTGNLYFTMDGREPTKRSTRYSGPLVIKNNCTIKTKIYKGQDSSAVTEARFFRLKYDYDLQISSQPSPQYAAEGPQTLIDGIEADTNWRKGNWLGYQGQDFECVIDMKQTKEMNAVSLNCLQDTRSWIIFPKAVNFYTSTDNMNFNLAGRVETSVKPGDNAVRTYRFEKQFDQKLSARYIKIIAENFGKLPDWHQGKGGDAYIFTDELEIK